MPEPVAPQQGQGGVSGALTRKIGPLKAWQWGLVIGGGYLLYRLISTGSLFGSGGGTTAAPDVPGSDTGVGGGSLLPDIVPPISKGGGSGGQAQADIGTAVNTVTTPVKTVTTAVKSPTLSGGNYSTGTSTMYTTPTPSIPKTIQPSAAIDSRYSVISAQQQLLTTAQHKAATVAANTASDRVASRTGITAKDYLNMPIQGPPVPMSGITKQQYLMKPVQGPPVPESILNPSKPRETTAAHKSATVAANLASERVAKATKTAKVAPRAIIKAAPKPKPRTNVVKNTRGMKAV